MHRRDALRTVAAVAVGVGVTGCDPSPTAQPAAQSAPVAPVRPSSRPAAPQSAAAEPAPTGPADEIMSGPRDRPRVALTFHGQGAPPIVERLLAVLHDHGGVHVTVLAVGTWLSDQPELARRILDAGHELGNHTQRHLDISTMNEADMFAEIDHCAQGLRRLTGSIGGWFRPSQAQHSTPAVRAAAGRVGYRSCLSYDVDSLDHTDPGAAAVTRTTLAQVRNGSIVSLHFGHAGTVEALPALLDGLTSRGLSPVTMTELMKR